MSIFGDFFQQFRRPREPRVPNMDIPQDILNDLYNDSLGERKGSEYSKRRDAFFPMDFMSEFEEMFNNFFKGFPVMAFPPPNEHEILSLPDNEEVYDNNSSTLQERMLNDKTADKQNRHPTSHFPFSFDGSRRPFHRFNEPVTREDRNLDEDLKAGDKSLDDILPRGNIQHHPSPPRSFSSFSSSVTRNSNGVVESKKTVRDSKGNEEVIVTRKIDGKEYTIKHKTDEHGNKETEENIVDLGTGNKRHDMLSPESSQTARPLSLFSRLQNWFLNENE